MEITKYYVMQVECVIFTECPNDCFFEKGKKYIAYVGEKSVKMCDNYFEVAFLDFEIWKKNFRAVNFVDQLKMETGQYFKQEEGKIK